MPIIETIKKVNTGIKFSDQRPPVIKWKGISMLRKHSFISTIEEILYKSDELDVIRIGLIGDMHSGKTTLSLAIAHRLHLDSKTPFTIKIFEKKELLDFKNTLAQLKPVNYIMIFDDVSFMGANANKHQITMVSEAISTIRHLKGGQDVKIILIMNYHYSKALDKFIRIADFKYITTVNSEEGDNMATTFGKKYIAMIKDFKKWRHNATGKKKAWVIKYGRNKEPLRYDYRKPFIPVLFWNEDSLRHIITPTRQFMDAICSKCTESEGDLQDSEVPIEKFLEQGENNFGKGNWLCAVKIALHNEGKNVFGKHVVQAQRFLEKSRLKKLISLEQCAVYYDMKETSTHMKKKLDGIME